MKHALELVTSEEGFVSRCSCGWEGNPAAKKGDARASDAYHGLTAALEEARELRLEDGSHDEEAVMAAHDKLAEAGHV